MRSEGYQAPIEILFQDKCLVIAIKPAGVPVHMDKDGTDGFVDALKKQLDLSYLSLIHRIDQTVSGIVLLAKNKGAAAKLSKQSREQKMEKDYLAVVWYGGMDDSGELQHHLIHDEKKNHTVVHDEPCGVSQIAILRYKKEGETLLPVETYGAFLEPESHTVTMLKVRLITGRTHQIRAQLAHVGHPIFGDRKYAGRMPLDKVATYERPDYPALVSCGLSFAHPISGKWVTYSWQPESFVFALFSGGES